MERTGSIEDGSTEAGLPEEADRLSPRETTPDEYVIELDVSAGFLWWWSIFDVIEFGGGGADVMAARSTAPVAAARLPRLSRQAAFRAGTRAARALSEPSGTATDPPRAWDSRPESRLSGRAVRSALVLLLAAAAVGVFLALRSSGAPKPRTEVLRSESPLTDIWVRITGPGGAVSYVGNRFLTGGAFTKFTFRKAPAKGLFLPPVVRGQKLCASTHVIQPGDAPQLQEWQGRRVAITIYGNRTSALYCAVLGYGLYLG
jgi:hypothetical protein